MSLNKKNRIDRGVILYLLFVIVFTVQTASGKRENGTKFSTNFNVSSEGVGKFFHISDWHVDPFYSPLFNSTTYCRNSTAFELHVVEEGFKNFTHDIPPLWWDEQPQTIPNFQFGQYGCDPSLPLAHSVFTFPSCIIIIVIIIILLLLLLLLKYTKLRLTNENRAMAMRGTEPNPDFIL